MNYKGARETFGDVAYVQYLHCGDCFTNIYICQNLAIVHFQHVQFIVGHLFLKRAVFKDCKNYTNLIEQRSHMKDTYV